MNIEQLTYIVEVAKTKSLASAAKTLNISQSALSQAITKLENELNLKLFIRSRSGAVPTKEGDVIIDKAKQALYAILELKQEADHLNQKNDLLRISVIPGLLPALVNTYISFKNTGSNLKIEVNEKGSMDILKDLYDDKIDIGFIAINKAKRDEISGLQFTPILDGRLLLYVSSRSPLITNVTNFQPEMLKDQLFVLYKDEYVQSFINDFQKLFGPVNIFFETTDVPIINRAIIEYGAVTIGHDISSKFNAQDLSSKFHAIDMSEYFDTSFQYGWIKKFNQKLSKETKRYIEVVDRVLTT